MKRKSLNNKKLPNPKRTKKSTKYCFVIHESSKKHTLPVINHRVKFDSKFCPESYDDILDTMKSMITNYKEETKLRPKDKMSLYMGVDDGISGGVSVPLIEANSFDLSTVMGYMEKFVQSGSREGSGYLCDGDGNLTMKYCDFHFTSVREPIGGQYEHLDLISIALLSKKRSIVEIKNTGDNLWMLIRESNTVEVSGVR